MKKQFRIYKPNKFKTGAASSINARWQDDDLLVFWTIVQQKPALKDGNAQFYWDDPSKHIILKLGESDIGQILTGQAKIYHKNEKGNTSFNFSEGGVNFGRKVGDELLKISHGITEPERELLFIILTNLVREMYFGSKSFNS